MDFITPDHIVWMAGGAYILGYLIINQIGLRLVLLLGTGFYIWFYWVAAAEPLWDAIILSVVMGVANLLGILALCLRRSTLILPKDSTDIYSRFPTVSPGDFRQVMRLGTRRTVETREQVTREDSYADKLTYVVSGGVDVVKGGDRFQMPDGIFVGEVAYVSGLRSAATSWVRPGSEIIQWDVAELRAKSARNSGLERALETMIARDLVAKVAVAVAPHSNQWRPEEIPNHAPDFTPHGNSKLSVA